MPSRRTRCRFVFPCLASLVGGLLATEASAQALALTVLSPARNALAVPATAPVVFTFSQPLATTPATYNAPRLFSQQIGAGLYTSRPVAGNTLAAVPARPFVAGETVTATLAAGVLASNGQVLASPQVYQFTVATKPSLGTFGGGSDLAAANSRQPVVGDVNGDGFADLLFPEMYNGNTAGLALNDGHGAFSSVRHITVGNILHSLALGDIDNDGDLDIIAGLGNFNRPQVATLVNDGAGNFSSSQQVANTGDPLNLVVGDVNGDGYLDILATNYIDGSISVLLNNKQGLFTNVNNSRSRNLSYGLALGDLDNDGDLDLLTCDGIGTAVNIYTNDSKGNFQLSSSLTIGTQDAGTPQSLAIGDVNGDGSLDFVAAYSSNVSVRLNNGQGSFQESQVVAAGGYAGPRSVALADVNGDGPLDLVASGGAGGTVSVRLNNGQGTFGGGSEVKMGAATSSPVLADVDGNGTLDIITGDASNTVSVRLNQALLPAAPVITRIKAGGNELATSRGTFATDRNYTAFGTLNAGTAASITGTPDPALYQTERFSNLGAIHYAVPVVNGQYTVVLHFAEFYWTKPGQRVFDGYLEGRQVLDHYDIIKRVGPLAAITESFNVSVADGTLNLDLSVPYLNGGADQAKLSALEIIPIAPTLRLRAGGGALATSRGDFAADQYYSTSSAVGGTSKPIAGTADPALYQQERYSTNGTLSYAVPVANGQYAVTLHFAELYWTQPGQRVFDAYLEGGKVLDHYDIVQKVGPLAAVNETFVVTVTDGVLNLDLSVPYLSGAADQAKLSALEILRVGASSPAVASSLRAAPASLLSAAASLSTYPNPSAGAFTLAYTAEAPQAATLLLTDPLGRVLHQQAVVLQAGDNQVAVAASLPAGLYRLTLRLASGQSQSRQVLIQP